MAFSLNVGSNRSEEGREKERRMREEEREEEKGPT